VSKVVNVFRGNEKKLLQLKEEMSELRSRFLGMNNEINELQKERDDLRVENKRLRGAVLVHETDVIARSHTPPEDRGKTFAEQVPQSFRLNDRFRTGKGKVFENAKTVFQRSDDDPQARSTVRDKRQESRRRDVEIDSEFYGSLSAFHKKKANVASGYSRV
jgi:regulator of replication initiation timing